MVIRFTYPDGSQLMERWALSRLKIERIASSRQFRSNEESGFKSSLTKIAQDQRTANLRQNQFDD